MFKGRGRDPRAPVTTPAHLTRFLNNRAQAPLAKPEPDYEVVEFPSDQYVNAKLQAPPPPPRPPTGHPQDAGASCGLCGGGGARVRCAECGRQALCASCDDMYHRHPKRRHHQRQALPPSQMSDVRPPLPPKSIAPVPPPRRHKISGDRSSASPKPPAQDQRRATLGSIRPSTSPLHQPPVLPSNHRLTTQHVRQPTQIQAKTSPTPAQVQTGSVPYLPSVHQAAAPVAPVQVHSNTIGHAQTVWNRPRALPGGYNNAPNMVHTLVPNMAIPAETWERPDSISPSSQQWGRPLRRGASVLELGGGPGCVGCGHCAPMPWRYGSCASLDHPWSGGAWPATCCVPPQTPFNAHMHPHAHHHPPQTPQSNRRGESRTMSRVASRTGSRAGSRAASPAVSTRSRASRRNKRRTPTPPPLSSSDADSESDSESDHKPEEPIEEESLGPAPSPPSSSWQCEHCTFVNEPGVRVCVVCCRTPTTAPKIVNVNNEMEKLQIVEDVMLPVKNITADVKSKQNGGKSRPSKERKSTSCGPSPPRDDSISKNTVHRHVTPIREQTNGSVPKIRHEMGCGPSPPRESHNGTALESANTVRASPYREMKSSSNNTRHSVSVGPSPPRDTRLNNQSKKSTGTSPSRELPNDSRARLSNTGTSPPPQTISTQTYEVPSTWERSPSVARNRSRRRFRDDGPRRERSHSRHSLSSDTRDSERSVRTSGGRWEWRETRDSSPGAEWSESERRRTSSHLTRRASHLDLHKNRYQKRNSLYGSEAASPEPLAATRAISLEALAGAGARRETERGLELAKLMSDAEKLGFSAAEVHAALGQNPLAPLSWLRSRWAGLCAGVRAAAARLQPGLQLSEREVRAALAKHRGAMWPAVTECVEKYRRNSGVVSVEDGRLRGHVWGSPVGVEDDAAPPQSSFRQPSHRTRAEESSDEFDVPSPMQVHEDDDWMFLPLNSDKTMLLNYDNEPSLPTPNENNTSMESEDFAQKLNTLLIQAGMPSIDGNLLLQGLLAENLKKSVKENNKPENIQTKSATPIDLVQSENDFINAYNALTRLSPLPVNVNNITNDDILAQSRLNTVDQIMDNDINLIVKSPINDQIELGSNVHYETRIPFSLETPQQSDTTNSHTLDVQNTIVDEKLNTIEHEIKTETLPQVSNIVVTKEVRSDEKSSNLNEIVDNTQKLIQQMKEEINSDINSLDERNMSESEEGNSSDQSDLSTEHESSFSESEDNRNDTSSAGHESSSSSDENSVNNSHKINRTSSEDNEQFEEAMDHIEEQMEDFKQTNMAMLDSIARSLQEEHTISVQEINNNVTPSFKESINKQFNAVDTFEEIYQDITNSLSQQQNQRNPEKFTKEVLPVRPIRIIYTKHEINVVELKNDPPRELMYSNHIPDYFNAVLDIVNETSDASNLNDINDSETTNLNNYEENNNIIIVTGNTLQVADSQIEITQEPAPPKVNEIETQNIDFTTQQILIENNQQQSRNNSETEGNIEADIVISQVEIDHTEPDKADVRVSPEKKQLITTSKTTMNKSSIPKPVKVIQNTTSKILPKVISSKVPLRRSSIKQYAAPAPPKAPFGKIQSGNVKQLQTKLFNNKPSKTIVNNSSAPIPSTSTFNKKKPAPPPPVKEDASTNLASPTKKKNYFRETCRTEDEWTDSDSGDSGFQPIFPVEEPPRAPPSPPPPVTLRRVSGQLIDLARVRLPEGSPERQARMLLAEGAIENWEQARLAVELVSRGTEPPAALLAALECNDLNSALTYLQQDCELCASRLPEHEMVSMLRCTHRCCRECAQVYFTVQITERSIADCVCPFCKEPELESLPEDSWLEYFAHLDILLKTLLEVDVHELFQRKLRDRTLALDPNFRWCVECSSGFFVHPKHKKLRCPECRSVSCATCRKPWSTNHDGLSCEEYAKWLEDNDPERSVAAVQQHLKENGLECPRCHFKYSLSRGGCMHFTCTQCKYEFCYGCGKPFKMGARCDLSEYCAKLGLHAHHPRNCLFYLRDKEPHELQTLLQMNNITFETEEAEGATNRCPIQLQRETPTGLVDSQCGGNVPKNHAGLCKNHYVEYLSRRIRARKLEPLPILGVDDLETLVRRAALRLPPRPYGTLEGIYKRGLVEVCSRVVSCRPHYVEYLAGLARGTDPIPIMDVSELAAELRRRALPLPERGPWDTDPIYAGMCAEIVKEKIPLD